MLDRDRFRLLCKYETPRVRVGNVLTCEARDFDVIVIGYTDGRIPWPVGKRKGSAGRGSPVVYGGLADAVRRESNQAVSYWFGVTPHTVSKWRKALGVGLTNAGTNRLRSDYTDESWAVAARKKAVAKAGDPERRRKISEAQKGRIPPPHVLEAARKARTGKPQPPHVGPIVAAAVRKRKAAGLVNHGRVWTDEEDQIVRDHPGTVAARMLGRTLDSVYSRRIRLGLT